MSSGIKKAHKTGKEKHTAISRKMIALILGILLIFWLLFDIAGIGGNFRFYAKWSECGQKPVVMHIDRGSVGPHTGPYYYEEAPDLSFIRLSPAQFCTPLEAELHGYSASPSQYDFPEILKEYGSLCRKEGDPQSETVRKFDLCKDR